MSTRTEFRRALKGDRIIIAPGVWDDWRTSTSHRYALQADEARRRGPSEEQRLTFEAPGPRGDGLTPRFFPDGTLLYHRSPNDNAPAYVRLDLGTGEKRELAQAYGGGVAVPACLALLGDRSSVRIVTADAAPHFLGALIAEVGRAKHQDRSQHPRHELAEHQRRGQDEQQLVA